MHGSASAINPKIFKSSIKNPTKNFGVVRHFPKLKPNRKCLECEEQTEEIITNRYLRPEEGVEALGP